MARPVEMTGQVLAAFSIYVRELDISENTRLAYERDVRSFLRWLEEQGIHDPAGAGAEDLAGYVRMLEESGRSAATISRSIASVRKFFAFALRNGYVFADPAASLRAPRVTRREPFVISDKNIRKLLNVPDTGTVRGIRDRAILELLISAGLSVSELTELRTADVDFNEHSIRTVSRQRIIGLGKKSMDHLKEYSRVRRELLENRKTGSGTAGSDVYFLSCAGTKMTRQGIWKIIRSCGKKAGMDDVSPQMMRHSFAVSALRHGRDAAALQKLLGHSSRAGSVAYQNYAAARD